MMVMCRGATALMSQRLDRPLTRRERLSLRLHLAMCSACRHCNQQLALIHRAGQGYAQSRAHRPPEDDPAPSPSDCRS